MKGKWRLIDERKGNFVKTCKFMELRYSKTELEDGIRSLYYKKNQLKKYCCMLLFISRKCLINV